MNKLRKDFFCSDLDIRLSSVEARQFIAKKLNRIIHIEIPSIRSTKTIRWALYLLILTIFIGICFRLYKIDVIPYGTNHDGAWAGLWAIELAQKPLPIQIFSNQPWLGESMPRYAIAFFIKLFGPTIFSLRLGMMVFTIIALPLFYLLVNQLFHNKNQAIFSTFLLAVSGWDITYAKSGWAVSSVPVFVILSTLFLIKAVTTEKIKFFISAGIITAFSFYTYRGGPMIFSATGIIIWYLISHRKKISNTLVNIAIFSLFFFITILPIAHYALTHWDNYISRIKFLSVHNKILAKGNLSPLFENISAAINMYTIKGHFGADFYLKEPLLDKPTDWLFIIGIISAIIQCKKKRYLFSLFFLLSTIIPPMLGNPDGGHAIGTLPAVYILAGIGLESVYSILSKIRIFKLCHIPLLCVILLLSFAAINTYNLYLGPHRYQRWGFYPETTAVAYFMKPKISKYDIYLTDNFPRDTLTYLTYQGGNPWQKHYTWTENGNTFLNVSPRDGKGLIFIMYQYPKNLTLMEKLRQKYPQGIQSELRYIDNSTSKPAAWVFIVDYPESTELIKL